ncbi:MAG: PIG-L family deacetylase [archaeon]
MNIVVFTAHSDDETGMMGTILKYIDEGNNVIKVVFSSGEKSQPHFKEEVIIKRRVRETLKISKEINLREVLFLNIEDAKIKESFNENAEKRIIEVLEQYNPEKIFIPSSKDPHIDHRSVNEIISILLKKRNYDKDLYSYEVWNIVNEDNPSIYINIDKYAKKKIQIMKEFKSQWHFMYTLILPMYVRSRLYGFKNKCKYAEKFYKLQ